MLLQTNSYIVPKDKRTEHARLIMRFRQTLARLGCDHFEAYEQVGANWSPTEATGRFVQIMRFRDRKHQQQVQAAERSDPAAQALIKEFCELINFPYQQQQGLFAVGFYSSILPNTNPRIPPAPQPAQSARDENGATTGARGAATATAAGSAAAAGTPIGVPGACPESPEQPSTGEQLEAPDLEPPPIPTSHEPAAQSQAQVISSQDRQPHQTHGPEGVAEETLLRSDSSDSPDASGSDPNGEFSIDEFIEQSSPPRQPEQDKSPDRAMQYEP